MNSEHPGAGSDPGPAGPPDEGPVREQRGGDVNRMALRAQRRQVANRLLIVLGVTLAVQVGASALLDGTMLDGTMLDGTLTAGTLTAGTLTAGTVIAGVLVVGPYAILLLLGAAWLPMPRDGFSWKSWLRSSPDTGAALDRLYWVLLLGGLLEMQLASGWLDDRDLGQAITIPVVLAPSVLMLVVVELRRRTRRRRAQYG